MAVDERFRAFGRWQASASARAMGETGILAETLLLRDRRSVAEAFPLLRSLDPSMTRARLVLRPPYEESIRGLWKND